MEKLNTWFENRAKLVTKYNKAPSEKFKMVKNNHCENYDKCLWEVATSSEEQLLKVYNEPWAYDLPLALHTVICQRLALITENPEIRASAMRIATMYSDPYETKNVMLGVDSKRVS